MKLGTKLPARTAASSSTSSGISAHRLSHAIAKAPPRKIRIVHILAPEIIKTEARHFRELVQRLTGKPAPNGSDAAAAPEYASSSSPPGSCDTTGDEGLGAASAAVMKAEVKEEPEMSSGGGYLRALGMEDGSNDLFFQGLEDIHFNSCNMDGFSF